jgi:DNA-directed RNA polymerase subunit F
MTAIALKIEDIDRRRLLWQKFKIGNIKPEEVAELRQILENERYLAITEGNVDILFAITTMIENIDVYMKQKGIHTSINIRPSNVA